VSRQVTQLERTLNLVSEALKPVAGRKAIDLALLHADAWAGVPVPKDGERGGSSHPEDIEERKEQVRVQRMAAKYLTEIPGLVGMLEDLADELHARVLRLTSIVHESKLPKFDPADDCANCRKAGHIAPVDQSARKHGLCQWCRRYMQATGSVPPVEAVKLYHEQSPRAAGLFLAKQGATV